MTDHQNHTTVKHSQTSEKPFSQAHSFQWQFLHPKYWGLWLLIVTFLPLIYLPLACQFYLGRQLGNLLYRLIKSRRQVTLINMTLAFPNRTDEERQKMARQVFINQGIGVFETLCAWFRPQIFTKLLSVNGHSTNGVSIEGLHHLQQAQEKGKAVLLLGGHYTMLDLGGRLFSQYCQVNCVYRPQNNPLMEWFIHRGRRHVFEKQISHTNMRTLVKSIQQGEVIWYSPDQDYGLKQGVMADFFGTPAATITASRRLAKLGNKSNPPALMGFHSYRTTPDRLSFGQKPHYQLTITPILENYPSQDEVADATRVNKLLEDLISIDPTQWMWFHKRYKHDEHGRTQYYNKSY